MNRLTVWKNSVRQAIETYDCDYKPFGELDGGDEPTKHGFATAEYDGESSCFAMGMRMYSAELGRFLSVDPLFEAMPRHTPYHYSFNSPLVWKDPSGLAPEKEKDQDRLMTVYFPLEMVAAAEAACAEENARFIFIGTLRGKLLYGLPGNLDAALKYYESGGGGRTGGDGSGDNATYKFVRFEDVFDDAGNHIGTNYIYELTIPTSFGNLDIPVTVDHSAIGDGQSSDDIMDAFVGGFNDIITADPTYFDNLWGREISVKIIHSKDLYAYGKPAVAIEQGTTNGSVLTFAGDRLTGRTKEKYHDGPNVGGYRSKDLSHFWQNYAMIGHEFAHAIHRTLAGSDWNLYSSDLKEHYAINASNRLRSHFGHPLQYNPNSFSTSSLFNKLLWPTDVKMWNKYNKRGY